MMEAIILAGGFGTRLRELVNDVPKPMAPVRDKPFLHYLFRYLKSQGCQRVVLSVGFKAELIQGYFGDKYEGLTLTYSREDEPLGTGGGLRLALEQTEARQVLVLNGDSFFDVDVSALAMQHVDAGADATLALRRVADGSRYGTIAMRGTRITDFREKFPPSGAAAVINGGVYVLDRASLLQRAPPAGAFSLETDFFAGNAAKLNFQGLLFDGYFIDIGVPDDYRRAQHEFADFRY